MMICRELEILPVEVIVRGYLAGSGWKAYQATGELCGIALPAGLRESDRLPEPIFTPSTKAEAGARREHHVRGDDRAARWGPAGQRTRRTGPRRRAPAVRLRRRDHRAGRHHPRRHEVRVRPGAARDARPGGRGPDPGLVALLGCGDLRARAGPRRASTSSSSATGSRRRRGTRPRPGRSCRPTSWPGRAPATSRRSSGSPGRASRRYLQEDVIAR